MVQATLSSANPILLAAAARGDGAAFTALYETYSRPVYNLVLRSVRDPYLAEDACQEIWLKVHREVGRLRDAAAFPTWLYRLAARICIDAARKRSRAPATVALEEDVIPMDADPSESTLSEQEGRLAWEALGALPVRQHSALFLKEVEGQSYREIAEAMGTSVSAVEDLLCRARRGLAKSYELMETAEQSRCRQAQKSMAALIDGEVTIVQRRALRVHADSCEPCLGELKQMRQASAAYAAVPLLASPSLLGDKILGALGAGAAKNSAGGLLQLVASAILKVKVLTAGITITAGVSATALVAPAVASQMTVLISGEPAQQATFHATDEMRENTSITTGAPNGPAPGASSQTMLINTPTEQLTGLTTELVGVILATEGAVSSQLLNFVDDSLVNDVIPAATLPEVLEEPIPVADAIESALDSVPVATGQAPPDTQGSETDLLPLPTPVIPTLP